MTEVAATRSRRIITLLVCLAVQLTLVVDRPAAHQGQPRSSPMPPPETPVARPETVICLDPGHPSETNSGFAPQNGLAETTVNSQVALRLADLLRRQGLRVVMTKTTERQLVTNRTIWRIPSMFR